MLVPIELSSMLVVGSSYRNKNRIPQPDLERISFSPESLVESSKSRYGNHWFSVADRKDRIIRIPAFELARVLLLHNSHLIRAAFRAHGLGSLASVIAVDETLIEIRFGPLTDFPASNLKNEGVAKHLAWLLMNKDVQRSFHSIYQSWQDNDNDAWNFNFSPPLLKGMTFTVTGKYRDKNQFDFVVREIVGVRFPEFEENSSVRFVHPRLKDVEKRPTKNNSKYESLVSEDDPDLNLQAIPGVTKRRHRVNDSRLAVSFAGTPDLKFKTKDKSVISAQSKSCGNTDEAGVGHGLPNGTAQEFDHALNRTAADDNAFDSLQEAASTSRFRVFEDIVARVAKADNFQLISAGCYFMPVSTKGSKAVTQTVSGRPVQYHLASMAYDDCPFVIIEVDTESMKKPKSLSTLVLGFRVDPVSSLENIMVACSEGGIKWSMEIIEEFCSLITTCNHPSKTIRNSGGKMRTPDEYKSAWVEIIRRRVEQAFLDFHS